MSVSYYLPGNRKPPPPSHRAGGITVNEEEEVAQFDPLPPDRGLGGGGCKCLSTMARGTVDLIKNC